MTFRTKLAVWYSGLLIIIILVLSLAVITASRVSMISNIDQSLDQSAERVIRNIKVMPATQDSDLNTRIVFHSEEIFAAPGVSVQVWQTHDDGEPIESLLVRASNYLLNFTDPLDRQAMSAQYQQYRDSIINDVPGRVATRPFYSGGEQVGIVQVAMSVQSVVRTNEMLLVIVLIAASVSIIVSITLSMWLAGRMIRPIERITEAAAGIVETEDLSTRLSWDGPIDEFGNMILVFNRMMERLEHLFQVQQRFVGDVSHEMRTPLTSILGHLEIMDRYGVDQESLEAVHREAGRMSRMVNDLLMLARADNGELKVELYPIDADHVMLEVYEQALILAKGRDLKLTLDRIVPVQIDGNADRLKQLLLNLVNNAIKFTPDGGSISLALYRVGSRAVLEVRDTGIGISQEDQDHIFDRFFQADSSRKRYDEYDGAGLGLSIVHWIAKVHRGEVTVDSAVGEGTTFRVSIPVPSGQEHLHKNPEDSRQSSSLEVGLD